MHEVTHIHTNAHTLIIEAGQPYTPPFQHNVQTMFSLYCTILTPLSILAQDEYSYGQVAGM